MFRVEFFVDDKKLADALRNVAGVARQLQVHPVVNVEMNQSSGRAQALKAASNGGLLDMFGTYLARSNVEQLRPKEIAEWLGKNGFSKQSASYLGRHAVEAGMMKKTGKSAATIYVVRKDGKHV
jgi:hypothetical protein